MMSCLSVSLTLDHSVNILMGRPVAPAQRTICVPSHFRPTRCVRGTLNTRTTEVKHRGFRFVVLAAWIFIGSLRCPTGERRMQNTIIDRFKASSSRLLKFYARRLSAVIQSLLIPPRLSTAVRRTSPLSFRGCYRVRFERKIKQVRCGAMMRVYGCLVTAGQ